MARKRGKLGSQSDPLCWATSRRSTAHLLGLFILGRALENLSMAALTRDFSSADSRRSPSSQPLTPLSPILSNLDREFSFAFSAQRWHWLPCHCPWRDWICAGLNRIEQLKIWIHQSPEELNPPIWNWKLQNPNSNVERSAIGQWMNFVPKKRKTGAC